MLLSLYEINRRLHDAIEQSYTVDEETGEIIEWTPEEITKLEMGYIDKLTGCIAYYKDLEAHEQAIDAEIKRLQRNKKTAQRLKEGFKNYIGQNCPEKTKTTLGTVSHRKSKAVIVSDESLLPNEYVHVTITKKPDKKKIKQAIESGEHIKGAYIAINDNVQIR